jgi:hypothetical protein
VWPGRSRLSRRARTDGQENFQKNDDRHDQDRPNAILLPPCRAPRARESTVPSALPGLLQPAGKDARTMPSQAIRGTAPRAA